jgi:hypothetical protein
MKRIKKTFPFLLLLVLFITAQVFAEDYFLYDAEGQKILFMGGKSTEFVEKLEMNKNPDYLMPTNDPDRFLTIYLPEITEGARGFFGKKEADIEKAGELVLFNVATGRTEDLIQLGFSPFTYDYTEDHKHFVISYRTARTDDSTFEVLYYNIQEKKSQKLTLPKWTKAVNQITVSPEKEQISLLLDNKKRRLTTKESKSSFGAFGKVSGNPELMVVSFSPLEVKKELTLESCPLWMFNITPERAVILCQNYLDITDAKDRSGDHIGAGTIKIINLKDYSTINEYKTYADYNIYRHWHDKDKVLILNYFTSESGLRRDIREIYLKIDATNAVLNEFENPTGNFEYLADKNRLYVITEENLTVIDYKSGDVIPCETGSNSSTGGYYEFMRVPDTDIAVIYKFEKSAVKFFDLNENRLIKKVTCGRGLFKALNSMYRGFVGRSTGTETTISVSPDKSKFFIYNKLSDDITVYDQSYEKKAFIAVKNDTCLGMYLISKPALQTVVIGKKKIYKLDYDNNVLTPIYTFAKGIEAAYLFSDETRSIVLSDKEIIVLDSGTLEIKNNFTMFVEKKEPHMKLKTGEQRYYFIPNL